MADPRWPNGTGLQGTDKRSTHYLRHILTFADDVFKQTIPRGSIDTSVAYGPHTPRGEGLSGVRETLTPSNYRVYWSKGIRVSAGWLVGLLAGQVLNR